VWKTLNFQQVLKESGVDGVMIFRVYNMLLKYFIFWTIINSAVLIPIHVTADGGAENLNLLSMDNIPEKSPLLWIHFLFLCASVAMLIHFLHSEYEAWIELRRKYFFTKSKAALTTVLISDVPMALRNPEALKERLNRLYGGKCEGCVVAYNTQDLERLLMINERTRRRYRELEPKETVTKYGCICWRADAHKHYGNDIQLKDQLIQQERTKLSSFMSTYPSAFASFSDVSSHAEASLIPYGYRKLDMKLERAPEPEDVIWPSLRLYSWERTMRSHISGFLTFLLVVFYTIPLSAIASLTTMENIYKIFPGLELILNEVPIMEAALASLLPSLAFMIFGWVLPDIVRQLTRFEGNVSYSLLEKKSYDKFFAFKFFNFFLVTLVAGVSLKSFDTISAWYEAIADGLPALLPYFVSFTMGFAVAGLCMRCIRFPWIFQGTVKWIFTRAKAKEAFGHRIEPPNFAVILGTDLLIIFSGLEFMFIAPLMLPFVVFYLVMAFGVHSYLLRHVYYLRFDTGGALFIKTIRSIAIGMMCLEVSMIGYFSVKLAPLIAVLSLIPLVYTIVFYVDIWRRYHRTEKYCSKIELEELGMLSSRPVQNAYKLYEQECLGPKENCFAKPTLSMRRSFQFLDSQMA